MKDIARKVFETEIESLQHVASLIDDGFERTVQAVLDTNGRVVVTGIGKSGIIGRKISATLASTGTPSFFLHPGEAFHGDLGMVDPTDLLLIISYSGETDELLRMIPFFKWNKNVIVSITGNPNSTLARNSDHHLNVCITREACPLELAPTSSTTTALVMGDALAVTLMEVRGFKHDDFARFHPGGSLGRKLLVKVQDVMRTDNLPFIGINASLTELLLKMSEGRLGMVIVGDAKNVEGIVTDGDLRRALVQDVDTSHLSVSSMMTRQPVFITPDEFIGKAEQLMLDRKIATVLVGNADTCTLAGVYQIYNS